MLDIHFTYFHIAFTLVLERTKPVLIQFPNSIWNANEATIFRMEQLNYSQKKVFLIYCCFTADLCFTLVLLFEMEFKFVLI